MSAAGEPGRSASLDARPTIIFLHATRLTGAQWATQVAALSGEFRCLTPDLPGHGTAAGVPFTLDSAARTVADVIDREASGRALVVGLSLGAYVAMDVASRWPERVQGLVLAGSSAEPRGLRSALYRGLGLAYGRPPERWLQRGEAWAFRRRYPPAVAAPILAGGFWFRGGSSAVRSIVGEEFRPRLARYPGPTLLVNGERDLLFRAAAPSFAAVAANARLLVVRRAGHRSNLDQPEAFAAAVRSFALGIATAGP